MTFAHFRNSAVLTDDDPSSSDLLSFAGDRGHPEFRCLSPNQNPSACVPCVDFSPWLRERARERDVEGLGEYLWRVRRADPEQGGTGEQLQRQYNQLAHSIMVARLHHFLEDGEAEGYLDLRVTLIMLAAHETFSGFIMAGEAADFVAAVMLPHSFRLVDAPTLIHRRNQFVADMGQGMDYWACWAPLPVEAIRSPLPPPDAAFQAMLQALLPLPLGSRAHAVDALRHLSADPGVPRSLTSLSRPETRRRGLDPAESARLIMQTGLVQAASDVEAWLAGWTRRDLMAFLSRCGVKAPKSWSKERLAESALGECPSAVRERMEELGVVELSPNHAEAAGRLGSYIEDVKETWRVWLGFGTGVRNRMREVPRERDEDDREG